MSTAQPEPPNTIDKRSELRKLRDTYKRLQTYLAICRHDLQVQQREKDIQERKSPPYRKRWNGSTRELRGLDQQEAKKNLDLDEVEKILRAPIRQVSKAYPETLDRKIASYKNRIRRTSVQLLIAAAAGHQYREINLATRDGKLVPGIDPTVPRKHRVFDMRRTSSLSSNEAAARAVKNWINQSRARRVRPVPPTDNDDRMDRRVSLEESSGDSSAEEAVIDAAIAMMSRARPAQGSRDWAHDIMAPIADGRRPGLKSGLGARPVSGGARIPSRTPNEPAAPDPESYDPRRWRLPVDITGAPRLDSSNFEQPKSRNLTGWMTWTEQEGAYPTTDSVLRPKKLSDNELWDPDQRGIHEEKWGREPLEPDFVTKLSIERRYGAERRELDTPLYSGYSQDLTSLPARSSEGEMRAGPLPVPPTLPLMGPSGFEVSLAGREPPGTRRLKSKRTVEDTGDAPLPVTQYHYPIDSPATADFRLPDRRRVAEVIRPPTLDEFGQIRGSRSLQAEGKRIASDQASYRRPYNYDTVPNPPTPYSLPLGAQYRPSNRAGITRPDSARAPHNVTSPAAPERVDEPREESLFGKAPVLSPSAAKRDDSSYNEFQSLLDEINATPEKYAAAVDKLGREGIDLRQLVEERGGGKASKNDKTVRFNL
ncbi:hypothetical protein GGS23DRAFT_619737 [Durotheca rogersii]|uniref:uncharacterized protein n=1 Tax=Durotheca rogersii TaxID=419775 RepID=UPI00221E4F69|nr:uncharacterized protein GGS23DRAFT_619737 [Durotheca rogersii]KAI5854521.1 hypothetical protein GGS23DRAFT_619737 [Durotheca rogersii]